MCTKPDPELKNLVKGLYFESLAKYDAATQKLYAGELENAVAGAYETLLAAVQTLYTLSRFPMTGGSEIAFHFRYCDIISTRFEKKAAKLLCAAYAWKANGELGYELPLERRTVVDLLIATSELLGYSKTHRINQRIL